MHLNPGKIRFSLFFLLTIPLFTFAGCGRNSARDESLFLAEFPRDEIVNALNAGKETVLNERIGLEKNLDILVPYAMFLTDPVGFQKGTDKVSFAINIEEPAFSAICKITAEEFMGNGFMQETIGDAEYIFPITKDDRTFQEVLVSNGLATIDPEYKGEYLGLLTILEKQAEVEGISSYSIDTNRGWVEEDTNPKEYYAVFNTEVYASPDENGTVTDTFSYGDKIVVRRKVVFASVKDPETGEITAEESEFYKIEGDEPGYILIDKLWDKKPVVINDARAEIPEDPTENHQLEVKNILQKPELPNGCEVTSLTIVLNYNGIDVDKTELSDNYLPKKADISADPNEYYLFEPRNGSGFYCFAGALKTCADKYLAEKGIGKTVEDLTGSDVNTLYGCIRDGRPVVVWGTLHWQTPKKNEYGLYSNLHCMVLTGYTDKTVTIADPMYGEEWATIDRATFETVWTLMGQRALLIY